VIAQRGFFRRLRPPVLVASLWPLLAAPSSFAQVVTSQVDNARSGADTTEKVLTPRNVTASTFAHRFRIPADGDVYAEPLYLPGLVLGDGRRRDVLFVATEHGSLSAWDADSATGMPLWSVTFVHPEAGVTAIPNRDLRCPFIRPEVCITSTPAIDLAAGTIYVLVRTREPGEGDAPRYVQRLHALDVARGRERAGSPIEIRAAMPGRGDGARDGTVAFDPLRENPRASLLLTQGRVILAWASSCDVGPYHGWVMAFDAKTLAQVAVLNTSPDASQSGIWQSDTGPAADPEGRVFAITGNGRFDANSGGRDYGNSVLALSVRSAALHVDDYFAPFNQSMLDSVDGDLGSGGPVLAGGDVHGPRRVVFASKAGTLYALDPDHLGGFHAAADSANVQAFEDSDGEYGAPAYWDGHVFVQGSDAPLRDFALTRGRLATKPSAESGAHMPNPGATPTISANGRRDGIVWMIQTKPFGGDDRPAVLLAYDAANVTRLLYSSEQNSQRDRAGTALRFTIPTVANGRVYVGTRGGVDVYGLIGDRTAPVRK